MPPQHGNDDRDQLRMGGNGGVETGDAARPAARGRTAITPDPAAVAAAVAAAATTATAANASVAAASVGSLRRSAGPV